MLNHARIAARVPHQGSMCLLAQALAWDEQHIHCRASSHRDVHNPLRAEGRLGAACGIEYAAQAMALHGSLLAGDAPPRAGFLASVRSVRLLAARLDDLAGDLDIHAERQSGDGNVVLYAFRVLCGDTLLLDGRATVVLDGATFNPPPSP